MATIYDYDFTGLATEWRRQRCANREDPNDPWALTQHLERLLGISIGGLPPGWVQATGGEWPCSYPKPGSNSGTQGNGGNSMAGFDSLPDSAIACIWGKRTDIASTYQSNGWQTGTVAQKRAALDNWWAYTPEAANQNPEGFARGLGCLAGGDDGLGQDGPFARGDMFQQLITLAKQNPIPTAVVVYFLFLRK